MKKKEATTTIVFSFSLLLILVVLIWFKDRIEPDIAVIFWISFSALYFITCYTFYQDYKPRHLQQNITDPIAFLGPIAVVVLIFKILFYSKWYPCNADQL